VFRIFAEDREFYRVSDFANKVCKRAKRKHY